MVFGEENRVELAGVLCVWPTCSRYLKLDSPMISEWEYRIMKTTLILRTMALRPHPEIVALARGSCLLLLLLPVGFTQAQEFHNFQNDNGKSVRATILAVEGSSVSLRLEGGRAVRSEIAIFSLLDQEYIKKWAESNKVAPNYKLSVNKISKVRKDRTEKQENEVRVVYDTLCYRVELANKTFESASGLVADYRVYKLPGKVEANDFGQKNAGVKISGGLAYREGSYQIPEIPRLGKISFETETLTIIKSELDAGYYYLDGGKNKEADDLKGIWLRIMHNSKPVFEHKTVKGNVTW